LAPYTRRLLIAAFIALMPMASLAQIIAPTEESSTEESSQSDSIAAPPAEQQNKTETNSGRFKPSESISEDLSVAFPVDI